MPPRFTPPPDRPVNERLFLVETHLDMQDEKLDKVVAAIDGMRVDFDAHRREVEYGLQRASNAVAASSTPPDGVFIPKWLLLAVGTVLPGLGAGIFEVIKLIAGR